MKGGLFWCQPPNIDISKEENIRGFEMMLFSCVLRFVIPKWLRLRTQKAFAFYTRVAQGTRQRCPPNEPNAELPGGWRSWGRWWAKSTAAHVVFRLSGLGDWGSRWRDRERQGMMWVPRNWAKMLERNQPRWFNRDFFENSCKERIEELELFRINVWDKKRWSYQKSILKRRIVALRDQCWSPIHYDDHLTCKSTPNCAGSLFRTAGRGFGPVKGFHD